MTDWVPRPLGREELRDLCGFDPPGASRFMGMRYEPPGPVGEAYIRSTATMPVIMGPGGSGKSVASIFRLFRAAALRMPVCRDGIVRARATVLRDNYRVLYRTTLRSWFEYFPPNWEGATFFGGADRPAQHNLKLSTVRTIHGVKREVPVDFQVDFFAVTEETLELMLKSYETSFGYVNEVDLCPLATLPLLLQRTGRFPPQAMLPPGSEIPRFVCADMNPPRITHPLLKILRRGSFREDFEPAPSNERPIAFFEQPSGLSPAGENRRGKQRSAYEIEAATSPQDYVERFVHGRPGRVMDGQPVYGSEFDRARHVASEPLAILPGVPLAIGFDQGLNPAAIFGQTAPDGQVRVLAEVVPPSGTGAERFLEWLISVLAGRLRGLPRGRYWADPAGFGGVDKVRGELSWGDVVGLGLGQPLNPAPSNEFSLRREAVATLLSRSITATRPALVIDPSCEVTIDGFEWGYRYPKDPQTDQLRPIKDRFSNPHDALQYLILGERGRAGLVQDLARAGRPLAPEPHRRRGPGGWSPFSV